MLGAHRQDHGARAVLVVADPDLCTPPGSSESSTRVTSSVIEARAEALGLVAELLHQLRAHDPLGEARVVLDVGRLLEQAAPEKALDDERPRLAREV